MIINIRTAKAAVEIGQRWGRIGKGFPFPYAVSSVRALGVMTAFGIPYVVQWKDVCSEEPVHVQVTTTQSGVATNKLGFKRAANAAR